MDLLEAPLRFSRGPLSVPTTVQKKNLSGSTQRQKTESSHRPLPNADKLRQEKYVWTAIYFTVNCWITYMGLTSYNPMVDVLLMTIDLIQPTLHFVEIGIIIVTLVFRLFQTRRVAQVPAVPENFVYLLPCYNETCEELKASIDSLASQRHLSSHKKALIVVADGQCKGQGMLKTTASYLTEDIVERPSQSLIRNAYTAWDGSQMTVKVVTGEFKGLPVICIIKDENKGKRDSICVMRQILYKFNQRMELGMSENGKPKLPPGLSQELFARISGFLKTISMPSVEYIVGLDADTRFDSECVFNLVKTAREGPQVVGVAGVLFADPRTSNRFSPIFMYQFAEYLIGQHRRRLRQDLTSGRVTCLPGCCQLIKVSEITCGDEIHSQFSYFPKKHDGLSRTIRSMMSEDRDHVCLVLSQNDNVEMKFNLQAKAFTSTPQSLMVFLSQRRRWTIGPIVGEGVLIAGKSTGWIERLAAVASLLSTFTLFTRFLSPLFKAYRPPVHVLVSFSMYYMRHLSLIWNLLVLVFHLQSLTGIIQSVLGLFLHHFLGRHVEMMVQLYTLYHLDNFRWGLTRVVTREERF